MEAFGPTVRWLREQRGWSQRRLAKKAETSDATICRVEQGQDPPLSLVRQLARAFQVPVAFLLHPPNGHGRPPATIKEARHRMTIAVEEYIDRARRKTERPGRGWVTDDDLQHVERAVLHLLQLDPTVLFEPLAPGYETLRFLMARAYGFKNRRFVEQLGAVLPVAFLEAPPVMIPTKTDADVAADDAAVAAKEESRRQAVLTEWRRVLDARHLELSARLGEERIGKRFGAIRQKLRTIEEAREVVQEAVRAPVLPSGRLAEFHAQRDAAKAASVSPGMLLAYRSARKQASRQRWQHTQRHQKQHARERADSRSLWWPRPSSP
jgi:transcriptional regulator with XRE-family HTH domain